MEEPDAAARVPEDHPAAAPGGRGALAVAAAPQAGGGFGDVQVVRGAQDRCPSTEEGKGGGFAVESVQAISAPFDGRGQIGEKKGLSLEERPMDVYEEKRGNLSVESWEFAESGNLRTCHEANGGFADKMSCITCGGAFYSGDVGCTCDVLDNVVERIQCDREDLACKTEIASIIEDLQMVSVEAHCDNEGLSDATKHDSKRWLCGAHNVGSVTDANNEPRQDDLIPKSAAEFSRPVCEDSVPSVSGRTDVSLDGRAAQVGDITSDSVTCPVAVAWVGNQGLGTSFGDVSLYKDPGCIYDKVDKVTEGNQCELSGFVCEEGILWDGVDAKTVLEDFQMRRMEPHCDNESLSDSGKHGTDKPPCGLRLMTDANHELQKDIFLANNAGVSWPMVEATVLSIYENPIDVPLDSTGGCAGEISENRTCMENVVSDSLEREMLSCVTGFQTQALGDECSWMGVSKGLASCCKETNKEGSKACDTYAETKVPVPLKQNDRNHGTSESPPERALTSSCNLPCKDEPCCSGRESSVLCLGHQVSAGVESGVSEHLVQDLNACNSAIDKRCSVVSVKNDSNELENQKPVPLIVFRRRNPRRAASSRGPIQHDQLNRTSNGTRKSKKVERSCSLLQSTMIKFPNKTTKGRSIRPLKSSAWGCFKKLMDGFIQNSGTLTSNSHKTCLENGRADLRMQPYIRRCRSSRPLKGKCASFSDIGCASDELNGQPTLSVTTTNASSEGRIRNVLSLAHALVNVSDDTHRTAQCTEGNHKLKLTSIKTDRQQLDRGLESITQETCPASIHGVCSISTSEPSLKNIDIGFSPDSVLEAASVACENNTSASHDAIACENLSGPVALTGGGLHASSLSISDFGKLHASSSMDLEQQAGTLRGNENRRMEEINPSHAILDNDAGEGKVQALKKSNTVRKNKKLGKQELQKKDGTKRKHMKNRSSTKISSSEASKLRAVTNDSSSLDPSEVLLSTGPRKFGSCSEALTHATQDLDMHEHDSMQGPSVTDNERLSRCKKKDGHRGKKGNMQDPHVKGKSMKKNIADGTSLDGGSFCLSFQTANLVPSHINEKSDLHPSAELASKNFTAISTELSSDVACTTDGASKPVRAWVCCDDCQKWRCIPTELADMIQETKCRWTCKDNCDKVFGDCSIPQEKTNAEINAELGLSDVSADEADDDGSNLKASRAPSWTHVRSNLFLHRNRRTQSIDESMVCNCKPPQDGRMGCRDGCLNRMLNIECVKRTCPCRDHCSNQQFQRRNYAKLNWFQSGKKGYGLQLKEDVSEGRFLIEYVGEVLDIMAYESRQRYYASKGQKHFYFMALKGCEVIDACTKGNLGRFINHSCSPNCRTEKWMVNGEVCIGIFAMRNIRKGEELTFDYNYVRVSGAAPQKCFCGSAKCRGYIGGDISGADIISQANAEAEYFEPMADKDYEEVLGANGSCSHGANAAILEHEASIQREDSNDRACANAELELHQQTSGTLFDISEPEDSLEVLTPQDAEDVIRTPVHVSRTIESYQFSEYGTQALELLQKPSDTMDTSHSLNVNGSAPRCDLGSNLVPGSNANKKNNVKHHKNTKPSSSHIDNHHNLGVEGILNSLLDRDGGISKRKNATYGYLKLLFFSAYEGDNVEGTSKSMKNLSLILDALLKTKSHSVLLDIIDKNGLQMLHNILKQNRDSLIRTPIIRKVLKILDFLASKGILTSEHINGGPRCDGIESFKNSILSLTRHNNTKVQEIARNFFARWIHCNIARSEPTEHPRASTSAPNIHGTSTSSGLVSTSNYSSDWNFTRRKRKSRWDYQPDDHYKMVGLKIQKVCSGHTELDLQTGLMRKEFQGILGTDSCHNNVPVMGNSTEEHADDEAPPGFETQQERQPVQAIVLGCCLERYQHNLSISYGIPVALVEHFGTPEVEGGQCRQKWKVAPGLPFNPFPPLPPYPRGSPCPSTSSTQLSQHDGTLNVKHNSHGYCERTMDRGGRVNRNWRNGARDHGPYHYQGRRFNHHRFERCRPPRPQEHGDSGFRGRE